MLFKIPDLSTFKLSFQLIWRFDKHRFFISSLIVIAGGFSTIGATFFLKRALSGLATGGNITDHAEQATGYLILSFACSILMSVLGTYGRHLNEVLGHRFRCHIEDAINLTALQTSMASLEDPEFYNQLVRAREAGAERIDAVFRNTVQFCSEILNLMIFAIFMITVSVWVLIIMVLGNFILIMSGMFFSKKTFELDHAQTAIRRRSDYIKSLITDQYVVKEIKTYNTGNYFLDQFTILREKIFIDKLLLNKRRRRHELTTSLLRNISWFASVGLMLQLVVSRKIDFTEMAYLFTLLPQVYQLINSLSANFQSIYSNALYAKSVFKFIRFDDLFTQIESSTVINSLKDHTIEFHSVSFKYPGQENWVLNDINLKIFPHSIIAIVGSNGSGKTTLIKLLTRLYEPDFGYISIGGVDIRTIPKNEYLAFFSVVFQDFARYHYSVADNIRFGDIGKHPDIRAISEAGKLSGAHDFIMDLPSQYDSMVGKLYDQGIDLSGGEWQKIAISRAFYRNSKFMLMDEPTSAMDATAEKFFFEQFKQFKIVRGVLLVTHKLHAIEHADYIYVLDEGKIEEHGSHNELFALRKKYFKLFTNIIIDTKN